MAVTPSRRDPSTLPPPVSSFASRRLAIGLESPGKAAPKGRLVSRSRVEVKFSFASFAAFISAGLADTHAVAGVDIHPKFCTAATHGWSHMGAMAGV
ncbi:UNVERIFIED_CONTAM: hypothetical protein HHA_461720 [Hammondia hammondi]|eukprot:XP_008882630.1 hypothetical protein HHA_461720 [Hammondia hammondi]